MKYLCLIHAEEKKFEAMPKGEFDALVDEHLTYDDVLRQDGHLVAAEALEDAHTATIVRMRNGKMSVTDGPFAETKEQLGGFYLIAARDLNDAIQMAAKIPSARVGSIEVRAVRALTFSQPQADR